MLKRILVLFLVLSLASAVTLEKSVEGESVLKEGEMVTVSLELQSDKSLQLLSLVDTIPYNFEPVNYPASCAEEGRELRCGYDIRIDTFSISYQLAAVESGKNIRIPGATLRYVNPETEVEESVVSNDIERQFFVGLPKISLNLTNFREDGLPSDGKILPNTEVSIVLQVKNPGSIDAQNLSLEVTSPLFSEEKSLATLRPDASTSFLLTGRAPSISQFSEGENSIAVMAAWTDVGGRSYAPAMESESFSFVRPDLFVTRDVEVKWKKEELLKPFISVAVEMENDGGAEADISLAQQLPETTELAVPAKGYIQDNVWRLEEKIGSGETKRFSIMIPTEKGTVDVPPLNVDYSDGRGNAYERVVIKTEEVEVEKTIWAILYKAAVEPLGDKAMPLAAVLLAFSLLSLYKVRNPPVMVASAAMAVLSALVLYTWYAV